MMMSISLQHLPKMDRCFILLFVRCCFSDISLLNYFKVNHSQRLSEAPLKPWLAVITSFACMERSPDGGLTLKKTHPYWTQVQVQLHVTGFQFAHFVVWTEQDLHIETIKRDNDF